jgi:hypothetical protein
MDTRTIRAEQLRRGHRILLPWRGVPTVHFVESVERLDHTVRFFARPESARGKLWDGRVHRDLAPAEAVDLVTR